MKTPPIPCDVAIEKSVPWLEEQLSPAEMEQVGEHLASCPDCAALFERLETMDLRPPRTRLSLGPDYWKSMDKAINKEMALQWGGNRVWLLTRKLVPIAALAIALMGWALIERSRSELLKEQISVLEAEIESQKQIIERLERANFQPKPFDANTFVLPVAHVPERHAL